MIVLVDDEEITLEITAAALESLGLPIHRFTAPDVALQFLEQHSPALIISDLMMPEMDGFAFRAAYVQRFPDRGTPFLFLSSMADPEIIVEGLEQGAADYLVKPVHCRILAAKVKNILGKQTGEPRRFTGDLASYPLSKLMRFCELKGLTGSVQIIGDNVNLRLVCSAGNFDLDDQTAADAFEQALDLTAGSFTITAEPIDYSELTVFQAAPKSDANSATKVAATDLPMGVLSGIRLNDRLFQVQSEYLEQPEQQIMTLVILDGRVIIKRLTPAERAIGRERLQKMLEEQHTTVEREVNEKINSMLSTKKAADPSPQHQFNLLFEEGWACYRQAEYARALSVWEEAHQLNPGNKLLESNLKIVRKKLAQQ